MTVLRRIAGCVVLAVVVLAVSPMLLLVLFLQWLTDDWEESWH